MFTMRRKQAYEALHPETRHGVNQHNRSSQIGNSSFTEDAAAKTGQGRSTIARDVARGARIDHDVMNSIRGTDMDMGRPWMRWHD
jgi:hypothetical protein